MDTTLTAQEFTTLLNLVAKAPGTIGDGFTLSEILRRAVNLANQPHPIGALVPGPAQAVSDPAILP